MIDASQIFPNVWVGGWSAARDTFDSFDVIYNVAIDAPVYTSNHFKFVDGPGNDIVEIRKAIDEIAGEIKAKRTVLVYCMAGRSRSVAITAAALHLVTLTPFESIVRMIAICRSSEPHQPDSGLLNDVIGAIS